MVCVEAGLDQSPQGESERWCPHRPPRGRDDAMRRFVPIDIGRVLPGEHLCARSFRAKRNSPATLFTSTERINEPGTPAGQGKPGWNRRGVTSRILLEMEAPRTSSTILEPRVCCVFRLEEI